jgi:polysaccharide chain length determinant protein (PEP-CTERM system associated)
MSDTAWADPAPDESRKGAGVERLRAIWQRRKWLAIVAFALPFAAAASLIVALPSVYRSTVVVLVERQQVPEEFVRATVTSELETRLQTITQEILSRSRLESLITRFNLYSDLRKQVSGEEVVERMRGDVRLELRSTDQRRGATTVAFSLSYQGGDPRTVAQVANTVASSYIEENLKSRERQAAGTSEFLKTELEEAKRRLDDQERKVSAFRTRHLGELPQQMQSNLTSLETLSAQLRLNSDNQLRATERREALTSQLAETATLAQVAPSAAGRPIPPEPLAARIARLKEELAAANARFTEVHPSIIRLRDALAAAEREQSQANAESPADGTRAKSQLPAVPPTPYVLRLRESLQGVEAELKVLKAEAQQLRAAIATYRARVESTPRREQEFLDLSRDYDTTKAHYQSLVKRHEDAQLAESMEQRQKGEQFRVVEPAIASGIPAAPNRLQRFALSFALAAGLAVGLVMLAEMLDTSFHSANDLRALGVAPILARIPRIVTEADARRQRRRFRLAAAITVVALVVVASASYLVGHGNERLAHLISRGA